MRKIFTFPEHLLEELYWDDGKENGNYYINIVYWGYIGIMEKRMESTI